MTSIKISQLNGSHIAAIRNGFPVESVKLGKTVATFADGENAEIELERMIRDAQGVERRYPQTVLRKLRKALADAATAPVKPSARKAPRKARKVVTVAPVVEPVIVEIHANLLDMVNDAPNEKARESWLRVLSAKYGVESVRKAFGFTTNFTGK